MNLSDDSCLVSFLGNRSSSRGVVTGRNKFFVESVNEWISLENLFARLDQRLVTLTTSVRS